jgi:predicted phage terminase large subunit-like protein
VTAEVLPTIAPQPGPQEQFLSTPADIAIYGGAAGGGKTFAELMEPLRHVHNKDFGAVIFRKSYPQIFNEGALWDEAFELYPDCGARPRLSASQWVFPAGSTVSMRHLGSDDELQGWGGSQIPLILFDELCEFTERAFWFMLSRNRSTCGVRPYMRATCNPDPESFVAKLISWWIGDDGFAIPERSGVVRWFIREGGMLLWADSEDECKQRSQDPSSAQPKSFTFILSRLKDNQILMRKDPGYLSNMLALLPIDRERLYGDGERGGNWRIKAEGGKIFDRSWFQPIGAAPSGGVICRFWDFAATKAKLAGSKGKQPDYTAGCRIRRRKGVWYVEHACRDRIGPVEIDQQFKNTAKQDAAWARATAAAYCLRWEEEPAGAGKRESTRMTRMVAGLDARGMPAQGDKVQRWKPFAAQAQAGNVYIVEGAWNEWWLESLHNQPFMAHDDDPDAATGSFQGTIAYNPGRAVAGGQREAIAQYKVR